MSFFPRGLCDHAAPRMSLFPRDPYDNEAPTPQSRNAAMAALLGALMEDPQESSRLLADADGLLLAPFFGVPDEGSTVYGSAGSTLEERVESYEAAMKDRINRTRCAGSVEAADALQCMLEYVLDRLGYAQTDDGASGGADMSANIESKLQAALDSDVDPEFDVIART